MGWRRMARVHPQQQQQGEQASVYSHEWHYRAHSVDDGHHGPLHHRSARGEERRGGSVLEERQEPEEQQVAPESSQGQLEEWRRGRWRRTP